MRLVLRIDLRPIPHSAAICCALALIALPAGVNATELDTAIVTTTASTDLSIETNKTGSFSFSLADASGTTTDPRDNTTQLSSTPADSSSMNDFALDDQVLSRQRGGATGMVMVAATPQLMRGNAVTLWDEIAPPSPLPIPIDAARAAQGNVANYQRK